MDGKAIVRALKGYVSAAKDNGETELTLTRVEQFIDSAEQYAHECYEYSKLESNRRIELFKSVISSGANAIKATMLINGGGAVALLAFAGKIQSTQIVADVNYLAHALFYFCIGVLIAALASGTTYAAQRLYHDKGNTAPGHVFTVLTVLLVLASYLYFFFGVYDAAKALGLDLNSV